MPSGHYALVLGTTKAGPRDDKSDSSGEIGKVHAPEEDTADEERQLVSVFFYRSKGNILQKPANTLCHVSKLPKKHDTKHHQKKTNITTPHQYIRITAS